MATHFVPDEIHPYALKETATEVSPTYVSPYIPTVIKYRYSGNMHMSHLSLKKVQKQTRQIIVLCPLHQLYGTHIGQSNHATLNYK